MSRDDDILRRLEAALGAGADIDERLQRGVETVAGGFEASTCTLHLAEGNETLRLRASLGLPPRVLETVRSVPFGKGMAGICARRKEPVTVCNLQTDASGVARPGAKETGVSGALVVPLLRDDGSIAGTLGVGKPGDHEYTAEETRRLERCAAAVLRAVETPAG